MGRVIHRITLTGYVVMWLCGYVVYGEVPDALTVIGAVVIVASGLIIWLREKRQSVD